MCFIFQLERLKMLLKAATIASKQFETLCELLPGSRNVERREKEEI